MRLWKYVAFLMMFFGLIACGGETPSDSPSKVKPAKSSSEAPASKVSQNTPSAFSQPCGGMTVEIAAEILGVPGEGIEYSYSDMLKKCSYRLSLLKSVGYAVYPESNPTTASVEMAKVVEGLKMLGACESVPGIADAAVYCGGDKADRFLVRKGAVWIDVQTPDGIDAKKRVADQVMQ